MHASNMHVMHGGITLSRYEITLKEYICECPMLTADTVYYYRILLYMQAHFFFFFFFNFCHAHIISRLEEEGSRGKGRRVVRGGEGRK